MGDHLNELPRIPLIFHKIYNILIYFPLYNNVVSTPNNSVIYYVLHTYRKQKLVKGTTMLNWQFCASDILAICFVVTFALQFSADLTQLLVIFKGTKLKKKYLTVKTVPKSNGKILQRSKMETLPHKYMSVHIPGLVRGFQ